MNEDNMKETKFADSNKNDLEDTKNAYNNLDVFLGLLLVSELYIFISVLLQIFNSERDRLPHIAGITTALIIMTIYHIVRRKKKK